MSEEDKSRPKEIFINLYDKAFSEQQNESSNLVSDLESLQERYSNSKEIAEGGMKKIFAVEDNFTQRVVAKAVIKGEHTPEILDDFIKEARITASLEHPNIVPVHDVGITDDKQPFFTMKKLGGQSFDKVISAKDKVSYTDKIYFSEIFLKVCDAVAFAHSEGILHMDLKPDNVQVNEFGEVLVCDWGLALKLDEYVEEDMNEVRGTPGYLSPEQITNENIDTRSDIYSLGAMLYYIWTGRPPIQGENLHDVLLETLKGNIAPLNNKLIPQGIISIITKALEPNKEDRYSSVSQLSKDVFAFIKGFAPEAEQAGFLKLAYLLVKRHKIVSLLILLFSMLILVLNYSHISSLNKEKRVAIEAKNEAEKSKKDLLIAQEESNRIRKESAPLLVQHALSRFGKKEYKQAQMVLDSALSLDPEYKYGVFYKAIFALGEHKFDEALITLQSYVGDKDVSGYIKFVKECIDLKKRDLLYDGKKAHELFLRLNKLPSPWGVGSHFIHTFTLYDFPPEKKFKFSESFLKEITKNTYKFHLEKINEKYALSLANNTSLYNILILKKLPINSLDLTNTTVKDLSPVKGMPIEKLILKNTYVSDITVLNQSPLIYLDISGTVIGWIKPLEKLPIETLILSERWVDINVLYKMPKLKKLGIPKSTFNEETINKLRQKFEVFFTD